MGADVLTGTSMCALSRYVYIGYVSLRGGSRSLDKPAVCALINVDVHLYDVILNKYMYLCSGMFSVIKVAFAL